MPVTFVTPDDLQDLRDAYESLGEVLDETVALLRETVERVRALEAAQEPPPPPPPTEPAPGGFVVRDATNTGIPKGTVLTPKAGLQRITTPGQVVSGWDLTGAIVVSAPNVTIENTRVRGGAGTLWSLIANQSTGLVVRDVELDGAGHDCDAISGNDYALIRANVHHTRDGARMGDRTSVEDSWFHDHVLAEGGHVDCIQTTGGDDQIIRGNNLQNPHPQTACVMIGADQSDVSNVLVEGNLVAGGGYAIYGGARPPAGRAISNIVIKGNRFARTYYPKCGAHGTTAAMDDPAITHTGSVWHDTGQTIT